MTNQQKIEIANWIQDQNIAGCYTDGKIECFSWDQFDQVDCILSDMGCEFDYQEHNIGGEFWIIITIK